MPKPATGSSGARAGKPKVYLIDIESSPNIGYSWGKFDQTIIKPIRHWELLSFAYKELGRPSVSCIARPDFKDNSDKELTRAVWGILDGADVAIAHNGDRFDFAKLRAKFVQHDLPPTRPFKQIDTKKIAKARFGFYSNSLNDIAHELGLGRKLETGGFDLWERCIAGDPAAWRKMIAYNRQDVVLLEKVYEKLKAWATTHPNLALHEGNHGCPVCASDEVQRRGWRVNVAGRTARFQCQVCGHWFASAALARELANAA